MKWKNNLNTANLKDKFNDLVRYAIKRFKTITPLESFVLITIVAVVVLLLKFFKIKESDIKIRVQVWDYPWYSEIDPYGHRIPSWKADQIQVGQKEYDTRGKVIAEIINVQKYDGNTEGAEIFLDLKIKVDYNKITRQYTYKNKTVDIGGDVEVKVDNIFLKCKVINNNIEKNKNTTIEKDTVWKNVRVRYTDVSYWNASKLQVGQKTIDADGNIIAEIAGVERFENGPETSDMYLNLKLRTIYNEKLKKYIYNNVPLDVGNPFTSDFNNVNINGTVIDNDLPADGYKQKEVIVTARWASVEPWQVAQMKLGDKMYEQNSKKVIAEILKFYTENLPNSVFLYKDTGEIGVYPHPTRKNAIFTVKLKADEIDSKLFFAGHLRIRAGDSFALYSDNFTYYLTVLKINSVKDVAVANK